MSDGRQPTPGCVDAETLAAFIDGRLEPRERAAVEAHLADCADCYEVWMDTARGADQLPAATSLAATARQRRWLPLAAAAAILLGSAGAAWFVFQRADDPEQAVAKLALAMGDHRTVLPRTSGPFIWALPPAPRRSDTRLELPLAADEATVAIRRLAEENRSEGTLRALGIALLVEGRLDEAVSTLKEAVSMSTPASSSHLDLSAAYLERWRVRGEPEDAPLALNHARLAVDYDASSPAARFNLALALESAGLDRQAKDAWMDFITQHPSDHWVSEARLRLADLERRESGRAGGLAAILSGHQGAISQAAQDDPALLDRAIDTWLLQPWVGNALGKARLAALALADAGRDRYPMALVTQASKISSAGARTCFEAMAQARREATLAFDGTHYASAETHWQRAADAARCSGAAIADLDVMRLQLDYFGHRRAQAIQHAAALEVTVRQAGYYRLAGRLDHMVGLHAFREGRTSDALEAYQRGLAAYGQAGDADYGAVTRVQVGEILSEQGDGRGAWREFAAAARALDVIEGFRRRHTVLVALATACQRTDKFGAAWILADEMIRLGVQSGNAVSEVGGHLHRARALGALRGSEAAVPDLDQAEAARLRIGDALMREQYVGEVAWATGLTLAVVKPDRAIAALDRALAHYTRLGFTSRLSEIFLERGRAHDKLGNRAGAENDWQSGIDLLEAQRHSIRQDTLRVSRISRLWELYSLLIHSKFDRPAEALLVLERSRSRVLRDRISSRGPALTTIEALRQWIPRGVTVVTFLVLPEELITFTTTTDGVIPSRRAIPATRLAGLVASTHDAVPGVADRSRAELWPLLFGSNVDLTATSTLVLVPDGSLHSVAFGALPVPGATTRLVEKVTVLVTPSIHILRDLPQPSPAIQRVVVVAASDAGPNLPRLPAVRREGEAIAGLYRSPLRPSLNGIGATVSALGNADLFHFSGHASTDNDIPGATALLLSADDALTADRVATLQMRRGSRVVLAACSTARGTSPLGEGPLSLARAFLMAGASGVIASVTDILDGASTRFLMDLHTQFATQPDVALALALAQRQAIHRGDPIDSWGHFTAIGSLYTER